ncbi:hypothetical protein [Kineosporia succinea]|uniref:Uncharacterized protein n=1 Tax=Kineosporia succinea TaxID=84632 RepID=A0ABT9P464_9ACTN|nr:hypothetical protein [Kineosporia succinea]MDP9827484.1 hypothetical protein [Kineosporia succinea]
MSNNRSDGRLSPRWWWFLLASVVLAEVGVALVALDNFLSGDTQGGSLRVVVVIVLGAVFLSVLRRTKPGDS